MCDSISLKDAEIHTLGEAKAYGWIVLPEDYDFEDDDFVIDDNTCFCCVDVEVLLERNIPGRWKQNDWGYESDDL